MVTSCPACTTTFRVTPEQLRIRQGKVRCGQCRGVFDAFKSLATLADDPAAAEQPQPEPAASAPDMSRQIALDIAPPPDYGDLSESQQAPARRRGMRVLGIILIGVVAAALLLPLLYATRDRLAAAMPATRPLLEMLCDVAGCKVAWPRRPDLLAIETSDLQAHAARPNVLVLSATVRNRGDVSVARPALELTLTNAQDQMLARRVLMPADYVSAGADPAGPMTPLSEVEVRIELDTGELRPAGYRLFLFYPTAHAKPEGP
jgi:predicted Zn finger-like uncharacterized protein